MLMIMQRCLMKYLLVDLPMHVFVIGPMLTAVYTKLHDVWQLLTQPKTHIIIIDRAQMDRVFGGGYDSQPSIVFSCFWKWPLSFALEMSRQSHRVNKDPFQFYVVTSIIQGAKIYYYELKSVSKRATLSVPYIHACEAATYCSKHMRLYFSGKWWVDVCYKKSFCKMIF